MMEAAPLLDLLLTHAHEAGIHLTAKQAFQCSEHARLMLEWNRRLNLTRITRPDHVVTRHILDSLIPARWLPRQGHALDVGTGPGFPGIPLKILHPALRMTLLDAQRKKVSFLRVVLSELALGSIRAEQGRWESMAGAKRQGPRGSFDLITMRAIRPEPEQLAGLGTLLTEGGMLVWWAGPGKGLHSPENLPGKRLSQEGVEFVAEHTYTLPALSEERRIIMWKRPG